MPKDGDIGLVKRQWNAGIEEDPKMKLRFWSVWNLVCFRMDREVPIKVDVVYVQKVEEPVATMPLFPIPCSPGGFHRIFRISHRCSHIQGRKNRVIAEEYNLGALPWLT